MDSRLHTLGNLHLHQPLTTGGRWGTTDDFTTSFLHSCVLHCSLGLGEICPVFFPLSLCLARWFWPDLMNGRHVHTTSVCVSLGWSCLRVVRLPTGSWHRLPHWQHGFCMRCVVSCGSTSSPWLIFFCSSAVRDHD